MDRKQIKREAPEGFGQSWLSCRAPYDAQARNQELEKRAWGMIQHHSAPVVMDLGCGSGNNVLFLAKKWPATIQWLGVDHDPQLIAAATRRCQDAKLPFTGVVADLLDLELHLSAHKPDLVVANAVFDLFTEEMMQALLADLQRHQTPMLTTLNYTSMAWSDPLPDEAEVIERYEAHMVRPRPSGNGLGPAAPAIIDSIVRSFGGKTDTEESVWNIPAADTDMQHHLLGFMTDSVPQMLSSETIHLSTFQTWKDARILSPSDLQVIHQDILITWE